MKRYPTILAIVSTAAGAGVLSMFPPWWSVAIAAAATTFLFRLSPGRAFLSGFCGVGLLWLVIALIKDIGNEHILSTHMAQLFSLPNYAAFIAVTVLIGGIVGGMSAWSASLLTSRNKQ